MTLTRNTRRALIIVFSAIVGVVYAVAWLAPGIGLAHDDAVYLVTAKSLAAGHGYWIESLPTPVRQTTFPPLFPAVLALFLSLGEQAQWLKLLPLFCTSGWLALTWKLLRKMGASRFGALALVAITVASPTIVFLGSNLLSEPLFSLLATAALLALLDDRPLLAGALAGSATLTRTAGLALIVACILTFAVRRKFRSAIVFSAAAISLVAPWLGWSLAHAPADYAALSVLTSLHASDKLVVIAHNFLFLLTGPFALLTGISSMYAATFTTVLTIWSLVRRRQLVPDLFLGVYCLMLLCCVWNPQRFLAPVLPLVLWLYWRAFHAIRHQEAVAAFVLILLGLSLWTDYRRLPATVRLGVFAMSSEPPDDWNQMRRLCAFIRLKTPADAILMANLDPVFYLNTGRKTIRGFTPDGFQWFYAAAARLIRPDQLSAAIRANGVDFAILTPDKDFVESTSYRRSMQALERAGILEPIPVPGLAPDYRLMAVKMLSQGR